MDAEGSCWLKVELNEAVVLSSGGHQVYGTSLPGARYPPAKKGQDVVPIICCCSTREKSNHVTLLASSLLERVVI